MSLGMKIIESNKQEYRKKGYWGDATLADYWNMAVLSSPEKVAVKDLQGTYFTYRELDEAAGRVATFLQEIGVSPGDFVSFQLPNWAEFTMIYIACLKVGAVVNPICPSYQGKELLYILNKCESKVLFIPAEFRGHDYTAQKSLLAFKASSLKEVVVVEKGKKVKDSMTLNGVLNKYSPVFSSTMRKSDDLAAVVFTSGTEGFPKGVMYTHNNIIAAEKALAASINFTCYDVLFMPAPVGHATGFHHGVTMPFIVGAKSVLQDIFKPDISLKLIERERCTVGFGPTPFVYDILRELKRNKYDISSLRFYVSGGAPIPRHMVREALQAGFKVLPDYGTTESVPHTQVRPHDSLEKIVNTDGKAVPGVEVKVVDETRHQLPSGVQGEEASRGPNVFVGYLKEPELTARVIDDEGWFYSGDLCIMDVDGYIRITGRKKDIIIRGGENISSIEVENILLQHPNVRETAVVAMPDERLGERVCAYVVLENSDKGLTLEDIRDFFRKKNMSKYKCPERLEIVKCLPRTESGKIQKYVLREDIKNKLKRDTKIDSTVCTG